MELTTPELAERLGVSQATLKLWESELGIKVPRGSRNRRKYPEDLVQLFETIKDLRDDGAGSMTLRQRLKDQLEEVSARHPDEDDDTNATATPATMEILRQLRDKDEEIARLNRELRSVSEIAAKFQERSENLGERVKLLEAPKDPPTPRPWWKLW